MTPQTPITVLDKSNVPVGPFTRAQVAEKLQSGEFALTDLAFVEGLEQWTPLGDVLARVDGVAPVVIPVAPPAVPAYSYAATMAPPTHLIYAGFWPRVLAHIIDNLVVSVPFIIAWVMVVMAIVGVGAFSQLGHSHDPDGGPGAAVVGTIIILYLALIIGRLVLVWLYHAMLESGPHQSTWGKRVMGLKVTSITGQRITFGHATGRYFSTIVTGMTMCIGYLMVAFTDRKQALHDMIAGTLVIRQ
jgi:uncharacterized RDD family membrane protein YckC